VSPDAIDYAVTIDDPNTFTKTWTIGVPLKQDKEQTEIFEYACHEGNYAMRNILIGARARRESRTQKLGPVKAGHYVFTVSTRGSCRRLCSAGTPDCLAPD
jgi:hypothetical protein